MPPGTVQRFHVEGGAGGGGGGGGGEGQSRQQLTHLSPAPVHTSSLLLYCRVVGELWFHQDGGAAVMELQS